MLFAELPLMWRLLLLIFVMWFLLLVLIGVCYWQKHYRRPYSEGSFLDKLAEEADSVTAKEPARENAPELYQDEDEELAKAI